MPAVVRAGCVCALALAAGLVCPQPAAAQDSPIIPPLNASGADVLHPSWLLGRWDQIIAPDVTGASASTTPQHPMQQVWWIHRDGTLSITMGGQQPQVANWQIEGGDRLIFDFGTARSPLRYRAEMRDGLLYLWDLDTTREPPVVFRKDLLQAIRIAVARANGREEETDLPDDNEYETTVQTLAEGGGGEDPGEGGGEGGGGEDPGEGGGGEDPPSDPVVPPVPVVTVPTSAPSSNFSLGAADPAGTLLSDGGEIGSLVNPTSTSSSPTGFAGVAPRLFLSNPAAGPGSFGSAGLPAGPAPAVLPTQLPSGEASSPATLPSISEPAPLPTASLPTVLSAPLPTTSLPTALSAPAPAIPDLGPAPLASPLPAIVDPATLLP